VADIDAAPGARGRHLEQMALIHSADLTKAGDIVAWSTACIIGDAEHLTLTLRTPQRTQSVPGSSRNHSPRFSPDGATLAFISEEHDGARILVMDVATGRTRLLGDAAQAGVAVSGRLAWSPDGAHLAYSATTSDRDPSRPYRVTRAIGWADGLDLLDDAASDVVVVQVDTGAARRLTSDQWVNHSPVWKADSSGVYFLASYDPMAWKADTCIRFAGLDGTLAEIAPASSLFSLATCGDTLLATTLGERAHEHGGLFAVAADGTRTELAGALDVNGDVIGDLAIPFVNPDPHLVASDTDAYVRVQVQDRLEVHRVAVRGNTRPEVVLSGAACFYPLALNGNALLYARGTSVAAPDLWLLDLDADQHSRITDTESTNAALVGEVTVDELWSTASGGPPVQSKFLRPAGTAKPLPTVLLIHGGPKTAFGQVFFTDAHVLSQCGFGVLMVNPRGSRGYGTEFADAITGAWGTHDYADLMAAVDLAVARQFADPDRLAVAGLSYGGFMSSWIVSHTDRFKAAVIENPVTNFTSFYGTSDIGLDFGPEIMAALPQDDPEAYSRCSPITTAHRCRTPSLLIQGERDHRCPPEQSKQFYSVLRRAGCVAEMLMLPGMSHEGSISGSVLARRAQNEALAEWMQRHVFDASKPLHHPPVVDGSNDA
jgi:dipeptidyl aminopeptidase/acylaminoacyl peptidase